MRHPGDQSSFVASLRPRVLGCVRPRVDEQTRSRPGGRSAELSTRHLSRPVKRRWTGLRFSGRPAVERCVASHHARCTRSGTASARLAIVAAHLGFPLGNGLTPLVFFWQPGRRHRAVREHCASAFDFQMTYVCSLLLALTALLFIANATQSNVPILLIAIGVVGGNVLLLFYGIRASIDGWRGRAARYPPSVHLLRRELRTPD